MLLHYPELGNGIRAVSSKPVSKGQSFAEKKQPNNKKPKTGPATLCGCADPGLKVPVPSAHLFFSFSAELLGTAVLSAFSIPAQRSTTSQHVTCPLHSM